MYEERKHQNEQASIQLCKQVPSQLVEPFKQKLAAREYTCSGGYALYKADMDYVEEEYSKLDHLGIKV